MSTLDAMTEEEAEIRAIVADWLKAVHARDVDAVMAHYADDFTGYDLFIPLKVVGKDAYRRNYEGWFSGCPSSQQYEIHEISATAGKEVAFCRTINRMTTPLEGGGVEESWLRVTVGYRKIDGVWKVIHEHVSVPIDMKTLKAVFDSPP